MAVSIIGALAAAASAAGGIYAATKSNNGAADTQAQLSRDALQNSLNQEAYQRALNTIALQRSTAGTVDGQGSSVVYDPATNTWRTTLSPAAARVQNSSNNATVARNTTDLRSTQNANEQATLRALMAQRASGPALAAVENFRPQSTDELAGALQSRATLANRQAEDPIIADTLRQFARTGTAAAPVLTQMQRDNADTLRKTVMDDTISAMTNGATINNTARAGLVGNYQALNGAANPGLNFSPISTQNPTDALAQETTARANTAGSVPEQGLFGTALGTNAVNAATGEAIKSVPNSNQQAVQIASISKQLPGLVNNGAKSIQDILAALSSNNGGNAGDLPTRFNPNSGSTFGNDAFNAGNFT